VRKVLKNKDLDALLDRAADPVEGFEKAADALISDLDSGKIDLEIRDSRDWRKPAPALQSRARTSFLRQFRADVDAILTLDREAEARLARRIEFARRRLARAREEEGLGEESESGRSAGTPTPRRVARRALELQALRAEMVERNLYLVLINVERFAQTDERRVDLIQEGCVSLFRAVDGFDWRRGLLFRTYAVHWLNQAFRNYLYNHTGTVRVPVYLQKALKHINQATVRLGDPDATPEQIAEVADLSTSLVRSARLAVRSSLSIDSEARDGQTGSRLRDLLVDTHDEGPYSTRLEDISLDQGLEHAMERLGEREKLVLKRRFGLGGDQEHTLAEVAKELGVSVERVRQIQVRALSKLNTPKLRRKLDPFLG
jgi:RNA polymerase primary sigma factor